jgi:hypothetical protein
MQRPKRAQIERPIQRSLASLRNKRCGITAASLIGSATDLPSQLSNELREIVEVLEADGAKARRPDHRSRGVRQKSGTRT